MTPPDADSHLEQELRALTAWDGDRPHPPLWERALAGPSPEALAAAHRHRRRRMLTLGAKVGVGVLVLALMVGALIPSMGRTRQSARQLKDSAQVRGILGGMAAAAGGGDGDQLGVEGVSPSAAPPGTHRFGLDRQERTVVQEASDAPADRQVVQKATMELRTADVKAAFLKCQMLARTASGEYVQDSSLTGTGPQAQAHLTLRVASGRLSEVLTEIRALGDATSEKITGEDVTGQVVDLDARLHNERRIEQELLTLLDQRQDAPLKDILELRTRLSEVRGSIEQLTAQQARLSRLVSLATVLVIIRPDDAPPPPPERSSLLDHLESSFAAAWRSGLEFLIDSSAWVAQVAIGGLIWWLAAIAAIVIATRSCRRAALLRGGV